MLPVARHSCKLLFAIGGLLLFSTATAQYLAVKIHGQTREAFFPGDELIYRLEGLRGKRVSIIDTITPAYLVAGGEQLFTYQITEILVPRKGFNYRGSGVVLLAAGIFFPLAILHNQYRHNEDPIAPELLAGSGILMIGAGLVCFRLAVKRYRANEKTKFKIIY